MTAGRGIVHSERTPAERAGAALAAVRPAVLGGAAARARGDAARPSRTTAPSAPASRTATACARASVAGDGSARARRCARCRRLFYVDVRARGRRALALPAEHAERAAYVVEGESTVGARRRRPTPAQLIVLEPGAACTLAARRRPARVMLLGGAPLDGPRFIWWNFVSSSRERIEQAKATGRAGASPPCPARPSSSRCRAAGAAGALSLTRPSQASGGQATCCVWATPRRRWSLACPASPRPLRRPRRPALTAVTRSAAASSRSSPPRRATWSSGTTSTSTPSPRSISPRPSSPKGDPTAQLLNTAGDLRRRLPDAADRRLAVRPHRRPPRPQDVDDDLGAA